MSVSDLSFRTSSNTNFASTTQPSLFLPGPTHSMKYGPVQRGASLDTLAKNHDQISTVLLLTTPPPLPVYVLVSSYSYTQSPASSFCLHCVITFNLAFGPSCLAWMIGSSLRTNSCARTGIGLSPRQFHVIQLVTFDTLVSLYSWPL